MRKWESQYATAHELWEQHKEFVAKELENAEASAAEDGQAPKEEKVEETSNYSSDNSSTVPSPTPTSSPLCAISCSASESSHPEKKSECGCKIEKRESPQRVVPFLIPLPPGERSEARLRVAFARCRSSSLPGCPEQPGHARISSKPAMRESVKWRNAARVQKTPSISATKPGVSRIA